MKKHKSYLNLYFIFYNIKQLINSNKFYTEMKALCVHVIIQNQLTRNHFIRLINKISIIVILIIILSKIYLIY
jgi:hypothetical protein